MNTCGGSAVGNLARYSKSSSILQQQGAVLAVSLVLLLVMTILGVSNMKSSSLELRMANNTQSRQHAFQAAETALLIAENNLQTLGYDDDTVRDCAAGTSTCYENTCEGGLCFFGLFTVGDTQYGCQSIDPTPPVTVPVPAWQNSTLDVWGTASKHIIANTGSDDATAQYIVEFLCFIQRDSAIDFNATNHSAGSPLYRITSLAKSKDGKAQVMLQSTYKLD